MAQQTSDPNELFPLLQSNDLHIIQEIKALIQENLNSTRDPGFLNALVDFYIFTNSHNALDLLAGVREPLDKPLMDRLNDNLKAGHKLSSLTVLSHVVRHQPSWLHKIVQAPLFTSLLNCLKMDTDVPVIMCGLLTVTTLLPMIPSLVGPFLHDIFSIFSRLASWTIKRPGSVPDVYQLHIQVAVYALFHRLYGMYPWNFIQYLRSYYQNRSAEHEFKTAVLPMLERVRMHPALIIGSARSETEQTRWRKMEVHDVLMECARVSLDTTESARDDSFTYTPTSHDPDRRESKGMTSGMLGHNVHTSSPIIDDQVDSGHKPLIHWDSDARKKDQDARSLVSSQEGGITMFSPSMVCGLSTPPQSHPPSPQGSQQDVSMTSSVHLHYTTPHVDTPTPLSTPRDSPHPSAASRLSSRMSSASDVSVHSKSGRSKPPWGRLPPISTQSAVTLGRTVSAPVTPGYITETKSLPCTPEKPLVHAKAASHEITKQRKFNWEDIQLSDSLTSNEEDSSLVTQPVEKMTSEETQDTRPERTESSVSLKDLPEVIKDLNHVEERPRDDEAINEEVSSFTGSPCAVRDLESSISSCTIAPTQVKPEDRNLDKNVDKFTIEMTELPQSTEQPTLEKEQDDEKSPIARIPARPETSRTQSDPSASYRNTTIKTLKDSEIRSRTSSLGSKPAGKIAADLFGVGKSQDTTTESKSVPQGFVPITESFESPFMRHSAQSTTSDILGTPVPPFTQHAPLQMPYMHLFNMIVPTLQNLTPGGTHSRGNSPLVSSANSSGVDTYSTPPQTMRDEPGLAGTASTSDTIGIVPLHSLYSPNQLLDRHLQLGIHAHHDQLTGLPLTSQESIDWTHFGGSPPADEIKLLKGQLQLLHNQLLYERHKREVHAERNRRLLGKTHQAKALEESNSALQKQSQLLEKEVNQLKAAFKLLREENKQLSEVNASTDQMHSMLMKKLQTENEHVRDANEELQKLLVHHKHEVDKVTKEVQFVNSQLFTVQQELDKTKADVATNRHLKDEIARLNKELLLMGETNTKYREKVEEMQRNNNKMEETEMSWSTLKKELAASQEIEKAYCVKLEAATARIVEMEAVLTQKDMAMADQKRFLENVKSLSKGKIEAMDGKYNALKKINQRLEAYILKLTKQLQEKEKDFGHGRRHFQQPSGLGISYSHSATDTVHKGTRSESLDSGRLLKSDVSSTSRKSAHRKTLERSQSHDATYLIALKEDAIEKSGKKVYVKTESDFSLGSLSRKTSAEDGVPILEQTGSCQSTPVSDFEDLSSETSTEGGKHKKETAEAIRVPQRDSPGRLSFTSPMLVFSDTSPFRPVRQGPSARHSSLSPSHKLPPVSLAQTDNPTSSRPSSRSWPNLESDTRASTVSLGHLAGECPAQAEKEPQLATEQVFESGSLTPPGAVVDSLEPCMLHHGLASIVHMEASIEETDLFKE